MKNNKMKLAVALLAFGAGSAMAASSHDVNPGSYQMRESQDDQYYWVLKAGNGAVLCTSEMYVSKQGVNNGYMSAKNSLAKTLHQEYDGVKYNRSSDNQYYWYVQSEGNHKVLCVSEMYTTMQAARHGVNSAVQNSSFSSGLQVQSSKEAEQAGAEQAAQVAQAGQRMQEAQQAAEQE